MLKFLLRVAGKVNGKLVVLAGAEKLTVFACTVKPGPENKSLFLTGHFIEGQPNPITDELRFFILCKSQGEFIAVEFILTQGSDGVDAAHIDELMILRVVNVNGQLAIDHDGVLHSVIAVENDFALYTARDALFLGQCFRFPDAGHTGSPLRTVTMKGVRYGKFFLLRNRLRTTAADHCTGNDQQSEDQQTQQKRQVFPAPFTAGTIG